MVKNIWYSTWFQQHKFIGGDRCILNTQNIVQKLMGLIQDKTKLIGRPGYWGPTFDEDTDPALSIRGGLDEAFAGYIMPELIEICKNAPFECLPGREHLLTVLDLLHNHIRGDRTSPVPIALTFGLHAMLTSIFVIQGDGHMSHLAAIAKQSYNKLFSQLDELSDESKSPNNAPVFYQNIGLFKTLVNLSKPVKATYNQQLDFLDPAIAERLAFWNPVIGGEFMLFGTYLCSIGLGSATVDSMGQLRFTLHLYHALKLNQPSLHIPLLEGIDKVFRKTKAVWVGGRPEKGSHAKHFWIAWGMSVAEASRMENDAKGERENLPSFLGKQNKAGSTVLRCVLHENYLCMCPDEDFSHEL